MSPGQLVKIHDPEADVWRLGTLRRSLTVGTSAHDQRPIVLVMIGTRVCVFDQRLVQPATRIAREEEVGPLA